MRSGQISYGIYVVTRVMGSLLQASFPPTILPKAVYPGNKTGDDHLG